MLQLRTVIFVDIDTSLFEFLGSGDTDRTEFLTDLLKIVGHRHGVGCEILQHLAAGPTGCYGFIGAGLTGIYDLVDSGQTQILDLTQSGFDEIFS